ncbi:helix-turn-helix transcriptional regulator [Marinococcus luteus]|uniref:helix-turn-helix transcriptional regulator n=1 Tax=Marinococcus luteus TaxID=1122204 RepID=UPI002ACD054D|nr:helix-turn-helix transcriptional regulator [Marinococcus luteus]MDZ5783475.1 helix-turn-helix transcriptional regulator [Marinococcus luteus]
MRDQRTEIMEEIQAMYTSLYNVTLLVVDSLGNEAAFTDGENELFAALDTAPESGLRDKINHMFKGKLNAREPFFYDLFPGIHIAVVPLQKNESPNYFLLAGLLVEEGAQKTVEASLESTYGKTGGWKEIIKQTPSFYIEEREKWLGRFQKAANVLALCFDGQSSSENHTMLMHRALQRQSTEELLKLLIDGLEEAEVLGIAEEGEEGVYETTCVTGKHREALEALSFHPGEGPLGKVLLSEETLFLENLKERPQSYFWQRYGLSPLLFFALPIQQTNGASAVIFGGSFSRKFLSAKGKEFLLTMISVIEAKVKTDWLAEENNRQIQQLGSLVEIGRLMAAGPDIKKVSYILIDASLSMSQGTFAMLLLKKKERGKYRMISRGYSRQELELYAESTAAEYFSGLDTEREKVKQAKTPWKEPVLECPLIFQGEILGVLCVGTQEVRTRQVEEFLEALSVIGGVSMKLSGEESGLSMHKQLDAMHLAVKQFDPEAFALSSRAAEIAEQYTANGNFSTSFVSSITGACRLSAYSPAIIQELMPDSQVGEVLEEGRSLKGGVNRSRLSTGAQAEVFAMTMVYAESGGRREIQAMTNISEEWKDSFLNFLEQTFINDQELFFQDSAEVKEESVVPAVPNKPPLSSREQEVLELIIKGDNNREIAEKLFISDHTVKNHVTKIFKKLDVPDRARAISKAYQVKYEGF